MTRRQAIFFTAAAFCLYLAFFLFAYADVVFQNASFAKRDVLRYYFPMWQYAVDAWKAGEIHFWNPYHSLGKPFAGNVQNCVFYPLQIILFLPDYTQAFNVYVLVHLAMTGAFTALWMRDAGVSRIAALTAGFAFAMSGYIASAINLTISLCSAAYFPLALLCWKRALKEKTLAWRIGLAVTLTLQYLAGDPAIVFSTLVVLTTFTLYKTVESSFEKKRFDWTPGLRFTFSIAGFLGLAAFHYPQFYELLKQSTRSTLNYDWATMWSVQFNDLIGLVVPFFADVSLFFMNYWVRQSWLDNYYAGMAVVLLAICAWGLRRDRITALHLLLFLFGLSLALGRFSGVYWFYNKFFPFFGLIRYPVRFFYVSYFALACLAGLAIDHMQRRSPKPFSAIGRALTGTILILGLALVWVVTIWNDSCRQHFCAWIYRWLMTIDQGKWEIALVADLAIPLFENVMRTLLVAFLAFAGFALYRTGRLKGRLLALFFAALLALDLARANNFEIRIDRSFMTKSGAHIEKVLRDKGLFRVYSSPNLTNKQTMPLGQNIPDTHDLLLQCFTPNLLLPFRIQDMLGYDSLHLDHPSFFTDHRFFVGDLRKSQFYALINGKYFVSPNNDLPAPFKLVQNGTKTSLYENPDMLPRAFLVRRAEVEPDRKKTGDHLVAEDFKPREVLYLPSDPGWKGPEGPDGDGSVTIDRYEPDTVEMTVDSPGPRWLFFSDSWYSAWRAWVDGKPVKIERANIAFRAVRVDGGRHHVVWKYDTLLFKIGLAVSLLTAAGLAWASRRKRGH